MLNIDQLKAEFNAKLAKTNSLDAAFTKAVWLAFKAGAVETAAHAEFAAELAGLREELVGLREELREARAACAFSFALNHNL